MKKIILLIVGMLITLSCWAADPTGERYYLNKINSNEKYYFEWNPVTQLYECFVPKLDSDFKIYQETNQNPIPNDCIFGVGDGQSTGVKPGDMKNLAHPGNNMQVEGGGMHYNCMFTFSPTKMELTFVSGGTTPPTPTEPTLKIDIINAKGLTPNTGYVQYTVTPESFTNLTNPTITVTMTYKDKDGNEKTQTATLTNAYTSYFTLTDLTPNATTPVTLTATLTHEGKTYTATTTGNVTTTMIPYIIGQLTENVNGQLVDRSWQPNFGIPGEPLNGSLTKYVWYDVPLTGDGEFSFVTKLGTSATDWKTVESSPRYVPANGGKQEAVSETWYPYETRLGSMTGNWYPTVKPSPRVDGKGIFEETYYYVYLDYETNQVMVEYGINTGVKDIVAEASAPVTVYGITGCVVRANADRSTALDGLPAGLYIMDGHKYMVK